MSNVHNTFQALIAHKTAKLEDEGWQSRVQAAEAQVAVLREALEWYEEQAKGCRLLPGIVIGDKARQALDKDGGQRARAALAQTEKGGDEMVNRTDPIEKALGHRFDPAPSWDADGRLTCKCTNWCGRGECLKPTTKPTCELCGKEPMPKMGFSADPFIAANEKVAVAPLYCQCEAHDD